MQISQFYGFLPFLLSAALCIVIGLSFKTLRKRLQRRSPLADRKIGNVPGQQLVERIREHEGEVMSGIMLMYMSFPILFMLWAGQKVDWQAQRFGISELIYVIGALLFFGFGLREYVKHFRARERAQDGLLAERVTGMQLNRLMAQGCIVMHDVPSDTGNIDHVVIAPRGVYAVETKSFRKPRDTGELRNQPGHQVNFDGRALRFPDFTTSKPIEQAMRHADWLRRYLRETIKEDIPVIAAVALPGWFVVQTDEVWRSTALKVFSPFGEGANFMAKEIVRIEPEYRSLISKAIALRFPVAA